jgi:hypothetical protein
VFPLEFWSLSRLLRRFSLVGERILYVSIRFYNPLVKNRTPKLTVCIFRIKAVGHNPNAYSDNVGVFDGLIGHQCQGWDEWQLTLHDLCGMSLRGLVQTLPAGFILFAYGYGLEYMLSGVLMGAIYSVGWAVPFPPGPFGQGIAFSELLWGAWTWGVFFYVIMTYRERPISTPARTIHGRRTSIARKIFFYTFLVLVDSIMIAACATYGQTTQFGRLHLFVQLCHL